MPTLVLATNNPGKVAEVRDARAVPGMQVVPIGDIIAGWESPVEDADTFEGNAAIKARAAATATGLPALADDSGLVVDALDGAPGVYSSCYAGGDEAQRCDAANNTKLLEELARVGATDTAARTARFISTLVLVNPESMVENLPTYLCVSGAVEGHITHEPRGDGGFGYDPLFVPDAMPDKTMAELSMAEKNALSHRGNALRELAAVLR
ncbi:MAG: RdgB/HAM1 family non-canonical purine NTP pyrophosphatase [Coriobacteriia bacterium]|nr:RdgB/HAM1 family non-canonical purine NTP pyrophosphatase [Coriobacteriia bacterium]